MQLSVTQMQSTPCHSIGKSMQASKIRRKYMNVFLLGRVPFWQQLVRTKSYELSTRAPVKFCGWGIVIKATKLARWEYTLFFLTLLYAYSKHCIQANHELHKNLYSRNVYFGTVQCTWSDMVVSKVSENLISEKNTKNVSFKFSMRKFNYIYFENKHSSLRSGKVVQKYILSTFCFARKIVYCFNQKLELENWKTLWCANRQKRQ